MVSKEEIFILKVGICEDNKIFALELKEIIYRKFVQYNLKCEIKCFYSGEEIINHIVDNNLEYDIIFFDIELPKLNGIETAKKIREINNNTIFIFISYLNSKVYETLSLSIFQFIRKDYFYDEVDSVLESLINKLDYIYQMYSFNIDGTYIYFKLNNILYFEVLNRHLILHTNPMC